MSVTCLAVGDPHFQVNNVKESELLIDKILLTIKRVKPTFVVLLGDLLHTHERIHVVPLNMANKLISSIAELAPVYVIIGNHDLINCSQFLTDNHAFNSFKEKFNVTICDKPILEEIGGLNFVFCPYVPPDHFEEALNHLGEEWLSATCIFAHQEFYGCSYNPTTKSENGDIWPEEYPLVISGHIHNEQRLQSNIYYPGTPMQHAFGESERKTVALASFSGGDFKITRIDLELRKKKIIYLSIDKVDEFVIPQNCQVKLVLKGLSSEFKLFRKSNRYRELLKSGITVTFLPNEEGFTPVKGEKRNLKEILKDLIKEEDELVHLALKQLFIKNNN